MVTTLIIIQIIEDKTFVVAEVTEMALIMLKEYYVLRLVAIYKIFLLK